MNEREMLEKMDLIRTRFRVSYAQALEVLASCDWDTVRAILKMEKEQGERPTFIHEMKVTGSELVERIKELIHEGNVNRIIIREESGREVLNLPVNGALAVAVLAPLLAGLGAVVALATNYHIQVERDPA